MLFRSPEFEENGDAAVEHAHWAEKILSKTVCRGNFIDRRNPRINYKWFEECFKHDHYITLLGTR